MAVDLHLHSTYSDGTFTPTKVVEKAHSLGLKCISLTDHDIISGVAEAAAAAEKVNLKFINGIELTAIEDGKEYHILGYFIDIKNKALNKHIDEGLRKNKERLKEIIKKLNAINFDITFEEVDALAGGRNPGRPHIARVLLSRGYIESIQAAFDRYIGSNCSCYIESDGIGLRESYDLLLGAGGIPSVAHPGYLGRAEMFTEADILKHRDLGAMAIEVFHTKHDPFMVSAYLKMAKDFEMGITGGSDCHGDLYAKVLMEKCFVPDWVGEKFLEFHQKVTR